MPSVKLCAGVLDIIVRLIPQAQDSQNPLYFAGQSDCPMENGYVRSVEGIHVLVDLQRKLVTEFEDLKFVPLPPLDPLRNYTAGETRGGVFPRCLQC